MALHQMRIALTRLRTAISFFSPMVTDSQQTRIRDELKWLNAHLGAARDLDVAIERLRAITRSGRKTTPTIEPGTTSVRTPTAFWRGRFDPPDIGVLIKEHLRLDRERALVDEKGKAGREGARLPGRRIWRGKLMRWLEKLLRKSRKLRENGCEEAASAASAEQEAQLFDRGSRRPVSETRGSRSCRPR